MDEGRGVSCRAGLMVRPSTFLETIRRDAGNTHLCNGTVIFDTTCPVSVIAAFTSPSVPAENKCVPSALNATVRQLPL